jgi:hypothetical protein
MLRSGAIFNRCCGSVLIFASAVFGQSQSIFGCFETSESRPCKLALAGAPLVYAGKRLQNFSLHALDRWIDRVYLNNGDPCPRCVVHFLFYDIAVGQVDYLVLRNTLIEKLRSSGEAIAFNGSSTGELLVTTWPKTINRNITYYQVTLLTVPCNVFDTGTCGALGSATKLVIDKNGRRSSSTDRLCHDLEAHISEFFDRFLEKAAKMK